MKISIFITITDPQKRQDPYLEAIENYLDFADEVVVVDGGKCTQGEIGQRTYTNELITKKFGINQKISTLFSEWPEEFDWKFIGEQFQRGYEMCTGDWVIRMDADYFLHEDDFEHIRLFLGQCKYPAAMFAKKQFLLHDRAGVKSLVPSAFNKGKYGDRIKLDSGGDLCQPSLDGKELEKDSLPVIKRREYIVIGEGVTEEQVAKRVPKDSKEIGKGKVYHHDTGIHIWNYDFTFKEKHIVKKDFGRFARAWTRHFKNMSLGGEGKTKKESDESAFRQFMRMQLGRIKKGIWEIVDLRDHPKYIRDKIKNINKEQFGYDMWGNIDRDKLKDAKTLDKLIVK